MLSTTNSTGHLLHANPNKKGFTVAHLNVRSLKNKLEEITVLLHTESINVLSLSETWLNSHTESVIMQIDGFKLYRHDRNRGTDTRPIKGGGLALYIDDECIVDETKYSHLNTSNPSIEMQIVLVKRGTDKSSIILNVYRPPSGNQDEFQLSIDSTLQEINTDRFADIYLLGDVNLNHHSAHKSEYTKNLESLINTYGLKQQIITPTRVTHATSSIIDVIYVRSNKKVTAFTKQCSLSDHFLVGCT